MLRDYRVKRYMRRLHELTACLRSKSVQLTAQDLERLAGEYADSTMPTAAECLAIEPPEQYGIASMDWPAPQTLWDEDAALMRLLLRHLHRRPDMTLGVALYSAVLCRYFGMSSCTDPEPLRRPAFPPGAALGDLLVDFVLDDEDERLLKGLQLKHA